MTALVIIVVHFFLVNTSHLSKWKGGGFGMYSEVHYYYNEVFIKNLEQPLDELLAKDKNLRIVLMAVKRMPSKTNYEKMAETVSKYVDGDTISIQVWKPLINSKDATYSRELINQYQYIKP
jgi:hypothetical protein